jgi:NAD-dependent DNA ligase
LGKKSAQNLLAGVEASKSRGLARLLSAIAIYGVSESMGPNLAAVFPTIDQLMAASKEALAGVEGFGPARAESVYNFFHSEAGQKLVADFRELGVKLTEDVKARTGPAVLAGKTVVVTGELQKYKRTEIEAYIKELGGKAVGSVSKNTSFVVVGDKPGSKYDKAKELKIPIYTEDQFEAMIAELIANAPPEPEPAPPPAPAPAPVPAPAAASAPPTPVAPGASPLAGKTFVVTGTFLRYGTKDIEKLIAELGGAVAKKVARETSYVVASEDGGAKLEKARELNVPVLSETDFEKMLAELRAGKTAAPAPVPEPPPAPAVAPTPAPEPAVASPLEGKVVVVTGTLMRYTRAQINARIEELGGTPGSSVTKATNMLVVGEDAGSKLDKARRQGIPVYTEEEFERMVSGL